MDKKKNKIEYRDLNTDELTRQLEKAREDVFKLQFRASLAPVKNTMEIRALRRQIARLKTFINQRREPNVALATK